MAELEVGHLLWSCDSLVREMSLRPIASCFVKGLSHHETVFPMLGHIPVPDLKPMLCLFFASMPVVSRLKWWGNLPPSSSSLPYKPSGWKLTRYEWQNCLSLNFLNDIYLFLLGVGSCEFILSLHQVGARTRTQIFRLSSKPLPTEPSFCPRTLLTEESESYLPCVPTTRSHVVPSCNVYPP